MPSASDRGVTDGAARLCDACRAFIAARTARSADDSRGDAAAAAAVLKSTEDMLKSTALLKSGRSSSSCCCWWPSPPGAACAAVQASRFMRLGLENRFMCARLVGLLLVLQPRGDSGPPLLSECSLFPVAAASTGVVGSEPLPAPQLAANAAVLSLSGLFGWVLRASSCTVAEASRLTIHCCSSSWLCVRPRPDTLLTCCWCSCSESCTPPSACFSCRPGSTLDGLSVDCIISCSCSVRLSVALVRSPALLPLSAGCKLLPASLVTLLACPPSAQPPPATAAAGLLHSAEAAAVVPAYAAALGVAAAETLKLGEVTGDEGCARSLGVSAAAAAWGTADS